MAMVSIMWMHGHRFVFNTFINFPAVQGPDLFYANHHDGTAYQGHRRSRFFTWKRQLGFATNYTSSDPAVATIVAGKVHIVGVGSCTITADQAGSLRYLAAPAVGVTLTVNSTSGPATTYDWTGAMSTDWKDAGNWQSTTSGYHDQPGY